MANPQYENEQDAKTERNKIQEGDPEDAEDAIQLHIGKRKNENNEQ